MHVVRVELGRDGGPGPAAARAPGGDPVTAIDIVVTLAAGALLGLAVADLAAVLRTRGRGRRR